LAVRVVDAQGSLLSLRYDTRLTFARWVAATQTSSLKRFQFSSVFRRAPGRRPPHDYLQADFDIVGGTPVLADAEAIKNSSTLPFSLPCLSTCCLAPCCLVPCCMQVAVEVVEGSGAAWGAVEVRLNHRDLLSAIWQWAGVTRPQVASVAQLLALLGGSPPTAPSRKAAWPLVRRQLLQGVGLGEAVVDRLQAVEKRFSGPADDAMARLTGALPPGPLVAAALEELGELLALLRVWGIHPACTTIDALMPPSHHYFSKCFFQVHARHLQSQPSHHHHHHHHQQHPLNPISNQRTTLPASDASLPAARTLSGSPPSALATPWSSSPPLCVAVGGRYDALLLHLSSSAAAAAGRGAVGCSDGDAWAGGSGGGSGVVGAVGFSVALHKLMAPSHPTTHHSSRQAAVDVLVCARGGAGLLSERMEVSAQLWAAGIKAEYVCVRAPSLTEQYEYAHEHGIKWLVLLTDAGLHTHSAKVRHLDLKTEEEVSLDDLVKFFLEALPSLPTSRRRGATAPSGSGAA
ncbi:unnamed protein product, partial [Closterium sp. NIES-54]